jgi:hypothetical protein
MEPDALDGFRPLVGGTRHIKTHVVGDKELREKGIAGRRILAKENRDQQFPGLISFHPFAIGSLQCQGNFAGQLRGRGGQETDIRYGIGVWGNLQGNEISPRIIILQEVGCPGQVRFAESAEGLISAFETDGILGCTLRTAGD